MGFNSGFKVLNRWVNFGRDTGSSLRFVDSPWVRVKLLDYSSWGITIMNTQAWPGGRCCERLPVEPWVACQGNYREARSIALMAGFEASLSYGVQVLRKRSHLRACERMKCKSVHNILPAGSVRTRCNVAWKYRPSCKCNNVATWHLFKDETQHIPYVFKGTVLA